jgi:hypothetical protein
VEAKDTLEGMDISRTAVMNVFTLLGFPFMKLGILMGWNTLCNFIDLQMGIKLMESARRLFRDQVQNR